MMEVFLSIFTLVLIPLLVEVFKNSSIIKTLSPVVVCYSLGILLGNSGIPFARIEVMEVAQICVALSIPLLLFGTNFLNWLRGSRSAFLSFIFMLLSVTLVTTIASLFFKNDFEDFWKVSGMLVGVYTGGTPNMSAIGIALDVPRELFILINGSDIVLGGFFLFFLLSVGPRLLGLFLKPYDGDTYVTEGQEEVFNSFSFGEKCKSSVLILSIGVLLLAISFGVTHLIFHELSMGFFMLTLTSLGIAGSFVSKVHKSPSSYRVGQYLLLVFCLGIGSLAELSELVNQSGKVFWFCSTVMIGSFMIHLILCKVFDIDRDTAVITSVAGIFGPPFIGPIADTLKNRNVIVSGLTCSLVGFAVGNYLGLALAYLLRSFL